MISRSPRSLYLELVGANSGSGRSIIDQGRDYVFTAKNYPHLFRSPKVTFEFVAGLPDRLADELRTLGIDVVGSEVLEPYFSHSCYCLFYSRNCINAAIG